MTNGWLPIESAPKDGTAVLLASDRSEVFVGWSIADSSFYSWAFVDDLSASDEEPIPANAAPDDYFTHWRPLPPPPSENEGSGSGGDICSGDGKPCCVGRDTDDQHYRCGTVQCGRKLVEPSAEVALREAREALEPFAKHAGLSLKDVTFYGSLTYGDLTRAADALARLDALKGEG